MTTLYEYQRFEEKLIGIRILMLKIGQLST